LSLFGCQRSTRNRLPGSVGTSVNSTYSRSPLSTPLGAPLAPPRKEGSLYPAPFPPVNALIRVCV